MTLSVRSPLMVDSSAWTARSTSAAGPTVMKIGVRTPYTYRHVGPGELLDRITFIFFFAHPITQYHHATPCTAAASLPCNAIHGLYSVFEWKIAMQTGLPFRNTCTLYTCAGLR